MTNEQVDHERWLAETWEMIEACAKSPNPLQRVALSPAGCAALLQQRTQLRGELSLAEEGLASFQQQIDSINPSSSEPPAKPTRPLPHPDWRSGSVQDEAGVRPSYEESREISKEAWDALKSS